MMTGHFYPTNEKRLGNLLGIDTNSLDSACQIITKSPFPEICFNINVPDDNDEDFNRCIEALTKAFDKILPQKSSFEK